MAPSQAKDVSLAGLVAVLAFLALKNWAPPPLEAPHVGTEKALASGSQLNPQRFEARLWQDPFAALASGGGDSGPVMERKGPGASDRQWAQVGELQRWVANAHANTCTILLAGVLTDSSTNPDRAEGRRRHRVALQEGMQAQQVQLVDPYHIGGLRYTLPATAGAPGAHSVDIPFELFERRRGADESECVAVVLLWLDGDYFLPMLGEGAPRPGVGQHRAQPALGELRGLMHSLSKLTRAGSDRVNHVLFGPEDSDQLKWLIGQFPVGSQHGGFPPLTIYSYASTAQLSSLIDPPDPAMERSDEEAACDLDKRLAVGKLQLVRTIRDDGKVWDDLWAEIEQRRLATGARRGQIVVVSSIGELYAEKLAAMGALSGDWKPIKSYRFMPDLNGSRAHPHDTDSKSGDRPSGESKQRDRQDPGSGHLHSEGDEQFDYVDRLAQTIVSDLADAQDDFLAVGVFGGDPHDKITLIRALRDRLDRGQFFTTDLDMRLLDKEHVKYTRNTLVGSAYGLALDEHIQAGFAPFRDAYQTALFFTAQVALGQQTKSLYHWNVSASKAVHCPVKDRCLAAWSSWTQQEGIGVYARAPAGQRTRVFEIGLDRFVPLPGRDRAEDPGGLGAGPAGATGHSATLSTWLARAGVGVGVLALMWLTVFGLSKLVVGDEEKWAPCPRHLWKVCREEPGDRAAYVFLASLIGIVVLVLSGLTIMAALETWGTGMGEPSALLQGVSIWGSIAFRWAGIFLAVWYLVLFLEINLKRKQQALPPRRPAVDGERRSSSIWRALKNAVWPKLHHGLKEPTSGDQIWERYVQRTSIREVVGAALIHVVAISLFMEALLVVGGQPADFTRTGYSHGLYYLSGRASAWLLFLLLYITTCVFRLCHDWMEVQCRTEEHAARIRWSAAERRRVLENYGLVRYGGGRPMSEVADLVVTLDKIGEHTHDIYRFVYAPFVVLAVMLLSTWQRFEYFQWPISAQLLLAFVILWAVYNAFILDRAATRAKANIVAVLKRRVAMLTGEYSIDTSLKDGLTALQHDATERDDGAFKPLLEQPYLRALLLPAGASTLLALMDMFNMF